MIYLGMLVSVTNRFVYSLSLIYMYDYPHRTLQSRGSTEIIALSLVYHSNILIVVLILQYRVSTYGRHAGHSRGKQTTLFTVILNTS